MDGMAGALIATMLMIGAILRLEAIRRMGEKAGAEWKKRWNLLSENERREEARADFESFKSMCAAGLNAANLAGVIALSIAEFAGEALPGILGIPPQEAKLAASSIRLTFAALILFLGIVPWSAIYLSGIARRAKQFGVFRIGRRGHFLDIGFGAVVLGCLLLAIPSLREWFLLVPYFVVAGISTYVFNAWVFFNRPPREEM